MCSPPEIRNIVELVKTARTDPVAGIRTVQVTGDDHGDLYVAEPGPLSQVTAYYPRYGNKIYQIIDREGRLRTGIQVSDNGVRWNVPVVVSSGDCCTVKEGEVYQRENTDLLPMIAVIFCPSAHIGHDRFIVQGAIPHQPGWDFYAALPF
jgi:hypothetical protein